MLFFQCNWAIGGKAFKLGGLGACWERAKFVVQFWAGVQMLKLKQL